MYRYVHANYRFIVDPSRLYQLQAVDADVHLDWDSILQILASAQSQSSNCPICLSIPVAPRMARCGHIFCLPCLIRYMHSTDDLQPLPEKKARWKKCPICWDSVYVSETRPVRWFTGQEGEAPIEGGDVVLRLIKRPVGSTLALPRDGAELLDKTEDIPWYNAAEVIDYARVMKGGEDYMASQFDSEIKALLQQETEDALIFGDEPQWTRKAVSAIKDAKDRLKDTGNPPSRAREPVERKIRRPSIMLNEVDQEVPAFYMIQHAAKSGQSMSNDILLTQNVETRSLQAHAVPETNSPPSSKRMEQSDTGNGKSRWASSLSSASATTSFRQGNPDHDHDENSSFFFYQALSHYYLSPLDIRILKAAFGDFSSFPATVLPRVERVSTGHIVDDDLRRRAKYLAHLPQGCEVGFLECNWTDVVVPDVLERFTVEIERRRKKNMEKEVREEKDRVRAEREEDDKRWATARRKPPTLPHDIASDAEFQPLASVDEGLGESASSGTLPISMSPPWPSSRARHGSAFASLASPSTSPDAPRTVWGTSIIAPVSPVIPAMPMDTNASENDGWLQSWENDLLDESDLLAQLQVSAIGEGPSSSTSKCANNKKKKGKKITLMTTNARRGA